MITKNTMIVVYALINVLRAHGIDFATIEFGKMGRVNVRTESNPTVCTQILLYGAGYSKVIVMVSIPDGDGVYTDYRYEITDFENKTIRNFTNLIVQLSFKDEFSTDAFTSLTMTST
jgi:hypothetical protein